VIGLLRAGDDIGLREFLKEQRRALERLAEPAIIERQSQTGDDALVEFAELMTPLLERYLAVSFPLIERDSSLWDEQVRALAELAGKSYFQGGYTMWIEMPRWLGWWLANLRRLRNGRRQASRRPHPPRDERRPLQRDARAADPGESTVRIGEAVMQRLVQGTTYIYPFFEQLLRTFRESESLGERYPEFAGSNEHLLEALNDFNFLATLYAGAHGERVIGTWTIYSEGGLTLSQRLRESAAYRARVAEQALGVAVEELEAHGQEWLGRAWSQPGYRHSDAHLRFEN
jgi:hypothetical protein